MEITKLSESIARSMRHSCTCVTWRSSGLPEIDRTTVSWADGRMGLQGCDAMFPSIWRLRDSRIPVRTLGLIV